MPTRIIREGINSSPKINSLSPMAELFYRRLMTVADDYGRFYAAPATLRGACWPTCPEKVTEAQIQGWLSECSSPDIQLISVYESSGCRYLVIDKFCQQTRSKSKFPEPDNHLLITCEAIAQPSRSRITKSEAEAELPRPSEIKPLVTRPPSPIRAIDAEFERIYERHPKKLHRGLAETYLFQSIDAGADIAEIERVHGLCCDSEDWQWKNGAKAPDLAQWLLDKGWKYPPKSAQVNTKNPATTSGSPLTDYY